MVADAMLADVMITEGVKCFESATQSNDPAVNFAAAIRLFRKARRAFAIGSPQYMMSRALEASTRVEAGKIGHHPLANYTIAVHLFSLISRSFETGSEEHSGAIDGELESLAALFGLYCEFKDWRMAACLREQSGRLCDPKSARYGTYWLTAAQCWDCSFLKTEGSADLRRAVECYEIAFAVLTPENLLGERDEMVEEEQSAQMSVLDNWLKMRERERELRSLLKEQDKTQATITATRILQNPLSLYQTQLLTFFSVVGAAIAHHYNKNVEDPSLIEKAIALYQDYTEDKQNELDTFIETEFLTRLSGLRPPAFDAASLVEVLGADAPLILVAIVANVWARLLVNSGQHDSAAMVLIGMGVSRVGFGCSVYEGRPDEAEANFLIGFALVRQAKTLPTLYISAVVATTELILSQVPATVFRSGDYNAEELDRLKANLSKTWSQLGMDVPPDLQDFFSNFPYARDGVSLSNFIVEHRDVYVTDSREYAEAVVFKAHGLVSRGLSGMHPEEHLRDAVIAYTEALRLLQRHDDPWALSSAYDARSGKARAHIRLAELGINPDANIEECLWEHDECLNCIGKNTDTHALALIDKAESLMRAATCTSSQKKIPLFIREAIVGYIMGAGKLGENDQRSLQCLSRIRLIMLAVTNVSESDLDSVPRTQEYLKWIQEMQVMSKTDASLRDLLSLEGLCRENLAARNIDKEQNLDVALSISRQRLEDAAPETLDWATRKAFLAKVMILMGRGEEAYEHLEQSLDLVERTRGGMQRSEDRIGFLETQTGSYAAIVALCINLADEAEESAQREQWQAKAWDWIHRGKSRALLELLAGIRPRLSKDEDAFWDQRAELDRKFKAGGLRDTGDSGFREGWRGRGALPKALDLEDQKRLAESEAQYLKDRAELSSRIEGLRELSSVDESGRLPSPEQFVQDLQELAHGTDASRPWLVEYFMFSKTEIVVFLLPLWETEGPMRPTIHRIPVEEGMVEGFAERLSEINQAIEEADKRFVGRSEDGISAAQKDLTGYRTDLGDIFDELGSSLIGSREARIKPWIEVLLEQTPPAEWRDIEIIFSPHYLLNLLPLHAATWEGKPLIEHWPVAYLPSPTLAGQFLKKLKNESSEEKSALDGQAAIFSPPRGLPLDKDFEKDAVVKQLKKTNRLKHQPFSGSEATPEELFSHALEAWLIHYCGHSQLLTDNFLRSSLGMAGRDLEIEEMVSRLYLPKALLVYLGSCDSGQVIPGRADELMALARVFLYAGSPTVLASLWKLPEAVGADFASYFYQAWLVQGKTLAAAFQNAVKRTRGKHGDKPDYWAPWILIGAWQTSITLPPVP